MSRQEKKTRIKGLPPKLLLNLRAAHTGSYPSIVRAASDNRTGKYRTYWDDTNTIIFTSSNNIIAGAGITEAIYSSSLYQEQGSDVVNNFNITPPDFSPVVTGSLIDIKLNGNKTNTGTVSVNFGVTGSEVYTSGPTGSLQSLDLTPNNTALIATEHLSALEITGSFTGMCMFSASSPVGTANTRYLFSHGTGSNYTWACGIWTNTNSRMLFINGTSTNTYTVDAGSDGYFAGWHHLAWVRTSTNQMEWYVNGTMVHTGSISGTPSTNNGYRFKIGWESSLNKIDGDISAVKLYDRALTATEIITEYSAALREPYVRQFETKGNLVKGISDQFVSFTPGQAIEPFKDHDHSAVDGKSQNSSFYATGSSKEKVGEGFSQPLWDKTKIEIDLTPNEKCSIQTFDAESTSSLNNHYVAYWNNNLKTWESICDGKQFYSNYGGIAIADSGTLKQAVLDMTHSASIAFMPSMRVGYYNETDPSLFFKEYHHGDPAATFGFPYHQKFHATSSNLIALSNYINQPFLLEKIVLHFSASLSASHNRIGPSSYVTGNGYYLGNLSGIGIFVKNATTTFFVMNQRRKKTNFYQKLKYFSFLSQSGEDLVVSSSVSLAAQQIIQHKIPDNSFFDSETNKPIDTTRDLITCMNVSTILTKSGYSMPALDDWKREVFLLRDIADASSTSFPYHNWNLDVAMSSGCKTFSNLFATPLDLYGKIDTVGPNNYFTFNSIALERYNSFRNGTEITGRSHLNELKKSSILSSSQISMVNFSSSNDSIEILENKEEYNPYLLFPSDNLIFGWQLPLPSRLFVGDGAGTNVAGTIFPFLSGSGFKLEWDTAPQKITLYGSYIKNGEEYHDTLNQLLINDNVHETIGED